MKADTIIEIALMKFMAGLLYIIVRTDISELINQWLLSLEYSGEIEKDGEKFKSYGIVFIPDPYSSRRI
jgi:hypothetical protein